MSVFSFFLLLQIQIQIQIQIHRSSCLARLRKKKKKKKWQFLFYFFCPDSPPRVEDSKSGFRRVLEKRDISSPTDFADAICLVIYVSPAHETLATMNWMDDGTLNPTTQASCRPYRSVRSHALSLSRDPIGVRVFNRRKKKEPYTYTLNMYIGKPGGGGVFFLLASALDSDNGPGGPGGIYRQRVE